MQNTVKHKCSFDYESKQVLQNYSYYPFGMEMPVRPKRSEGGGGFDYNSSATLKNDYLYNFESIRFFESFYFRVSSWNHTNQRFVIPVHLVGVVTNKKI